jgi:hypothetical protein
MMAGGPARAYDQLVTGTPPTQATPRQAPAARAAAWYATLPPKRRERVQDAGLAIGLALLNVASLVPYAPMDLAPAIAFATVIDRSRRPLSWLSVLGTVIGNYADQSAPGHNEPYPRRRHRASADRP